MLFQSNVPGHSITVRSETVQYGPTGHPIKGSGTRALRVKFRGNQRTFDTAAEAAHMGWTPEERSEVERFLLQHHSFMAAPQGSGPGVQGRIYLAHGEKVPEEHQELFQAVIQKLADSGRIPQSAVEQAAAALPDPPMYCHAFDVTPEGPRRCDKLAAQGSDLCEEAHKTAVGAVV